MTEPYMFIHVPGMENAPHVVYMWVIMIFLAILTFTIRGALHMVPSGAHNLVEVVVSGLADFMDQTIGHGGRRFMPLVGTLAFFILISNLLGLIPGFASPTANLNTNLAMALTVFVVYNFVGIQKKGLIKYIKHFAGPLWWLAPLMFPIEIISHIARPITLSVRLFGNVRGDEMVILVLLFLVPLVLPVFMMAFTVFFSILQTLVFILLTMVYLAGALQDDH